MSNTKSANPNNQVAKDAKHQGKIVCSECGKIVATTKSGGTTYIVCNNCSKKP